MCFGRIEALHKLRTSKDALRLQNSVHHMAAPLSEVASLRAESSELLHQISSQKVEN